MHISDKFPRRQKKKERKRKGEEKKNTYAKAPIRRAMTGHRTGNDHTIQYKDLEEREGGTKYHARSLF